MSDADFGTDIAMPGGDLDPSFGLVSGRACLIQDVRNRLSTPRGSLLNDPNYGLDVRSWCSTPIDGTRAFALQTAIANEVTKDDRVLSATAVVTFDATTRKLLIVLAIVTAAGPFRLTLEASALTVDVLAISDPQ